MTTAGNTPVGPKLDPLALLTDAVRRIPQLKWAFGVIGVAAAAVIVQALVRSPVFGLAGIIGVIVAMVVLFVFSRVVSIAARATRPVAVVFMWFVMIVAMAAIGCLFWSTFFNEPWPLRSKLFAQEVTRRAEAAGLDDVAKASSGLSEQALTKLVELGKSRHMVGWFDPRTDIYHVTPIPPAVRELDAKGLIQWTTPVSDYERLIRRLGHEPELDGTQPQQIRFSQPLSEVDRESLREFGYRLNDKGESLYQLILGTLLRQIQQV